MAPMYLERCSTEIKRSGSGNGSGFSKMPFMTLKIAVVAPIPIASVSTVVNVKPGERPSRRRVCRSCMPIHLLLAQRPHRVDARRAQRGEESRQCADANDDPDDRD